MAKSKVQKRVREELRRLEGDTGEIAVGHEEQE